MSCLNKRLNPSEGPFPVFVYGTLMSGQPNNRLLTGSRLVGAVFIDESEGFEMRDLGAYPGLIESRPFRLGPQGGTRGAEHSDIQSGKIWGELWMVDFETMQNLDRLEGLSHTNDPRDGLYYRREVDVYEDNIFDTVWTDVSVYVLGSVWSAPRVPATEVFGHRQYSWASVARRSRGWVGSGC